MYSWYSCDVQIWHCKGPVCSKLICDLKLPLNKKDGSHLLHFGRYFGCETCFTFASSESYLLLPSLGSSFLLLLLKQLFNISNPTLLDHCAPVGLKIYRCCSNRYLWQSFTRIFRSSLPWSWKPSLKKFDPGHWNTMRGIKPS